MIVTDAARSGARVFRTPVGVSRTDRDGKNPRGGNNSIRSPRLTSPVMIDGGSTVSPTRTGSQDIIIPKGPTGSVEVRNARILNTSVNGNSAQKGDPTPNFNKLIGQ